MAPLYSRNPARAFRQLLADGLLLLWCCWWWRTGAGLGDSLTAAADSGERVVTQLGDLSTGIDQAGDRLSDLPFVGSDLSRSMSELAGALSSVASSVSTQQATLGQAGHWLVVAVVAVPVALGLLAWAPPRLRFVRNSLQLMAIRRTRKVESMLALRALVNQPLARVARVSADPVSGWRADEPGIVRDLANLHLRELGLRGLE